MWRYESCHRLHHFKNDVFQRIKDGFRTVFTNGTGRTIILLCVILVWMLMHAIKWQKDNNVNALFLADKTQDNVILFSYYIPKTIIHPNKLKLFWVSERLVSLPSPKAHYSSWWQKNKKLIFFNWRNRVSANLPTHSSEESASWTKDTAISCKAWFTLQLQSFPKTTPRTSKL